MFSLLSHLQLLRLVNIWVNVLRLELRSLEILGLLVLGLAVLDVSLQGQLVGELLTTNGTLMLLLLCWFYFLYLFTYNLLLIINLLYLGRPNRLMLLFLCL